MAEVIMPNMGGYELLDRLRVQNNDIRALFLSGETRFSTTSTKVPDMKSRLPVDISARCGEVFALRQ